MCTTRKMRARNARHLRGELRRALGIGFHLEAEVLCIPFG